MDPEGVGVIPLGPTVAGLFAERLGKGEGALWAASILLLLALFPALPQKR